MIPSSPRSRAPCPLIQDGAPDDAPRSAAALCRRPAVAVRRGFTDRPESHGEGGCCCAAAFICIYPSPRRVRFRVRAPHLPYINDRARTRTRRSPGGWRVPVKIWGVEAACSSRICATHARARTHTAVHVPIQMKLCSFACRRVHAHTDTDTKAGMHVHKAEPAFTLKGWKQSACIVNRTWLNTACLFVPKNQTA